MSKFVFFCISDSCECESLHSKCPSHTLSEHTLTWCSGPIFHVLVILPDAGAISTSAEFLSYTVAQISMDNQVPLLREHIVSFVNSYFHHISGHSVTRTKLNI